MLFKQLGKLALVSLLIIAITSMIGIQLFENSSSAIAAEKEWTIGVVSFPYIDAWIVAELTFVKWYAQYHDIKLRYATAGGKFTGEQQIKEGITLLETGVDGLIIEAAGSQTLKKLVDVAKEKGVPVITWDVPIDSPDVLMFVGVSQYGLGNRGGEYAKELLIEKYGAPESWEEPKTVFTIHGNPANSAYTARALGFESAFKNMPNINIESQLVYTVSEADSAKQMGIWLAMGNDFDVAWAPTGGGNLGIVEAVKKQGIDPSTKIIVASDAYPTTLDYIRRGIMKGSTDQPLPYYGAIALKYMVDYLEGKSLPEVGEIVTFGEGAGQINIEGGEQLGLDPWGYDEEIYLPVEVVDWKSAITPAEKEIFNYTFPWFKCKVALITKENVDSPALWGNFPADWAKAVR